MGTSNRKKGYKTLTVTFHPHALERIEERGTTKKEVAQTVEEGESFPAKW